MLAGAARKPHQPAGAAPTRGCQLLGYWHAPLYRAKCAFGRVTPRQADAWRNGVPGRAPVPGMAVLSLQLLPFTFRTE
jgi:hypothetical protein